MTGRETPDVRRANTQYFNGETLLRTQDDTTAYRIQYNIVTLQYCFSPVHGEVFRGFTD